MREINTPPTHTPQHQTPSSGSHHSPDGDQQQGEGFPPAAARAPAASLTRRRTLQVADLHRHLEALHVERELRARECPSCRAAGDGGEEEGDDDHVGGGGGSCGGGGANNKDAVAIDVAGGRKRRGGKLPWASSPAAKEEAARARALHSAALVADQNLKLSIFATRPAISSPFFNLLTEAMGTCALILLALLIELQARRLPLSLRPLYVVGLQPLLITFTIVMLVAGLGGPTTCESLFSFSFSFFAFFFIFCCVDALCVYEESMPPHQHHQHHHHRR